MDKYTSECLERFKSLVDTRKPYYGRHECYDFVYPFTNESIKTYLGSLDFSDKKRALTVLSSGDHPFNLVSKGITDIDTFDINRLTEYYALGLKRAMIMKYSYQEFIDICSKLNRQMFNRPEEYAIEDIVFDLSGEMDQKYRDFWIGALNYIYSVKKEDVTPTSYIFRGGCGLFTYSNDYLKDEESYNVFKERLSKTNISFNALDISDVPSFYKDGGYDIVLLSNILDYALDEIGDKWHLTQLMRFTKMLQSICNDGADIVLEYLYLFNLANLRKEDIQINSHILYSDLRGFSLKKYKGPVNGTDSGIVLKKVRKSR